MKYSVVLLGLALALTLPLSTGCKTTSGMTVVTGQILVSDAGKVQKTGLAPVWIYDATNTLLTTNLPLPDFGGRSRQDWKRIVTAYPQSLSVYSNYAALQPLAPKAEIKRNAANEEFYRMKAALNGQTNGPAFDALQRQQAEVERLLAEENRLWDAADDLRDLIVLWYNLNPGILYAAGLPHPLQTVQTDRNGIFHYNLPAGKKVLVAAHIEGSIHGQPGNYFWLLPVAAGASSTNVLVLDGANAARKRTKAEMPQVILPEENGYLGAVGFWMLNRVRDARMSVSASPAQR